MTTISVQSDLVRAKVLQIYLGMLGLFCFLLDEMMTVQSTARWYEIVTLANARIALSSTHEFDTSP